MSIRLTIIGLCCLVFTAPGPLLADKMPTSRDDAQNQNNTASGELNTSAGATSSGYRALEWQELVPETWETPLILPAPGPDGHYPVDPESLVHELDGQQVSLPGYVIPIQYEGNTVTEFLFVPFLTQMQQAHAHHEANQMVYVRLASAVNFTNPYVPYVVNGELRVESVTTDDGITGYTVQSAELKPYDSDQ